MLDTEPTVAAPDTDPTLTALLALWPTLTPDKREFVLFAAEHIAADTLGELWEELDDILAADASKAEIAAGGQCIPLEELIANLERDAA